MNNPPEATVNYVLLDVDLSLVDDNGDYLVDKQELIKSIKHLQDNGIPVGLNTARSLKSSLIKYKELGCKGIIIAENGGISYDPNEKSATFASTPIKKELETLLQKENNNLKELEIRDLYHNFDVKLA